MNAKTLLLTLLCVGCGTPDEQKTDCPPADQFEVFADGDGDGVGGASAGFACAVGSGQVDVGGDCDDADKSVLPGGNEQCNGVDDDCDGAVDQGFTLKVFYADEDKDGYGDERQPLLACDAPNKAWSDNALDCDDGNADVHPDAVEVCSGIDEDCDQLVDVDDDSLDRSTLLEFYPDADGDGYGDGSSPEKACAATTGLLEDGSDCDDKDAAINPAGLEVCNGHDDDCDTLFDDLDDSVDPAGLLDFFADADGDGAGDPDVTVQLCKARPGAGVTNSADCDDTTPAVSPQANEQLCDGLDNDCDPLTSDDADKDGDGYFLCVEDCNDQNPEVHPGAFEFPADKVDSNCDTLEDCYQDVDGDGSRGQVLVSGADGKCTTAPNIPASAPIDCDDNDPAYSWSGEWQRDADGDGYGAEGTVIQQCADPGPGYLLEGGPIDCNDADPDTHPSAPDACNDGSDADCDASDACPTCADWLASDPSLTSGVYQIRPETDLYDVYCDMETDGGGWTLVASTFTLPLIDAAGPYSTDLTSLTPAQPHPGVWSGLRSTPTSDLRVACKLTATDADFAVDLSFYDVPWYGEITTGADADSCFSEQGNPDAPPARRDNLTGDTRDAGVPYASGALEGEDTCSDVHDFTVDFDDRGMDGNQSDGTDWGEDDGKIKCGESGVGEAWFVFTR